MNRQFRAGICDGCHPDEMDAACSDICRTATPDERAAADELTRELDTVYAEPATASLHEKIQTAVEHGRRWRWDSSDIAEPITRHVNEILAAERAAMHARYEAVASRITKAAANPGLNAGNIRLLNTAAAEIRKVAAQ